MNIDPNFNFRDPLKLVTIFREPIFKDGEEGELTEEQMQEMGIKIMTATKNREYDEYQGNIYVLWEDVLSLKSYPYKDEWKKFKGEKYYIAIEGQGPEYLIYGDLQQMLAYWSLYRNKYSRF